MLLKYIKLKNFRQYQGEQVLNFACEAEHNVTVILGDNTSGKTTFVQSFNWILYGKTDFKTQILLNRNIASEMKVNEVKEVVGELVFEQENLEYKIRRVEGYTKKNEGTIYKIGTKETLITLDNKGKIEEIKGEKIQEVINSILPENLSNYFFFDGEKIEKISEKKDMSEAVKNLLGLKGIETALKHFSPAGLTSVTGKLRATIQSNADVEFNRAQKEYELAHDKRTETNKRIEEYKNELEICDHKIDDTKEQLIEFKGLDDVRKKEKKYKEYEMKAYESYETNKKMFKSRIEEETLSYFIKPLIKKAEKIVENSTCIDEGIPNMTNKSLRRY